MLFIHGPRHKQCWVTEVINTDEPVFIIDSVGRTRIQVLRECVQFVRVHIVISFTDNTLLCSGAGKREM